MDRTERGATESRLNSRIRVMLEEETGRIWVKSTIKDTREENFSRTGGRKRGGEVKIRQNKTNSRRVN